MLHFRKYLLCLVALVAMEQASAQTSQQLLDKGWQELVRDNDTTALKLFGQAYVEAVQNEATEQKALSLLYMGFCSYGYSYGKGLSYANRAIEEFKKLEKDDPAKTREGISRCLQLIATIKGRQGQFRESIELSREALKGFVKGGDTTGTLGLIYNGLGIAYKQLGKNDSSEYYHRLALDEHLRGKNTAYVAAAYVAAAYVKLADLEREKNDKVKSWVLYSRAMEVAEDTDNRQARAGTLVGMGEWYLAFENDYDKAESSFKGSEEIAAGLSDRFFTLRAAEHLLELYKRKDDLKNAFAYQEKVIRIKDSIYLWDKQKEVRNLEIQFELEEKDRQLIIARNEQEVATLANYFLWSIVALLVIAAAGCIIAIRKIKKKDKQLLQAKAELAAEREGRKKTK